MNLQFTINKSQITNRAFTLIELLIAIAIIGILASIGLYTYPNAQKLARDSQRKSDLKQYQTLLENYANRSDGIYVVSEAVLPVDTSFCETLGLSSCFLDPKNISPYQYNYISNALGTNYVLWDKLESKKTTTYWRVCSSGKSEEVAVEPTDTNCL